MASDRDDSLSLLFPRVELLLFLRQFQGLQLFPLFCLFSLLEQLLLSVAHEHLPKFLLLFFQVALDLFVLGLLVRFAEHLFLHLLHALLRGWLLRARPLFRVDDLVF